MEIIKKGKNPRNGGLWATFTHEGKEFYADLCDMGNLTPIPGFWEDNGTEIMIFQSENGEVTSWRELYVKRGIPVTEKELLRCINEFVESL